MTDTPAAIVTGASRGIGSAIAVSLAKAGYQLIINYCSNEASAQKTKEQVEKVGYKCGIVQADVSKAADRQKLVDFANASFGRCDMLVNNAGVAPLQRVDLLDSTEESFDRVMGINLKGPYFLSQLVAKWMVEQQKDFPDRSFKIINIGSISAYASSPARGEYCVSKAAMGMMTTLFADRLAEYNINVYEIRPGIIETDIAQGLTPIKRWGRPEDVGAAVRAIAEGSLDFSTGQIIDVDGGFHMRTL
jgi:NAD(P)-dependent dehydrogenase (short-subunit alcohol dehydrogenase family)